MENNEETVEIGMKRLMVEANYICSDMFDDFRKLRERINSIVDNSNSETERDDINRIIGITTNFLSTVKLLRVRDLLRLNKDDS